MLIVYFSVTRYPTEKAYGVTVFYTMKAIENLGHNSLVISPDNFSKFGKSSISKILLNYLWNYVYAMQSNRKFISKLIFIFKRIISALLSKYLIPDQTDILWVRDPIIGFLSYRKLNYKKVVLEVHQPLNFFEKCSVKWLQKKNRLILAPISIELHNNLIASKFYFNQDQMVLSPMSVPNSFLARTEDTYRGNVSNRFIIGYVGGIKSSGVDQDIFSLITCIQNISFQTVKKIPSLHIYGVEQEFIKLIELQFSGLISTGALIIEMRQSHESLLPKLKKCDAFILPYPEGEFFKNRFPLKALEYAALRRPILVTATTSHQNIFRSDEVWFYTPGNCISLSETINKVIENPEKVEKKIELAYSKALNHSYINRALKILNKIK